MNQILLEFWIAFRYIFNRNNDGFISLISVLSFFGITLGVATLIIVMSVMGGFEEKFINTIFQTSGHISITANRIENFMQVSNSLKEYGNITPLVQSQALVNANNVNLGVFVFGIKTLAEKPIIIKNILNKNPNSFTGLAIGKQLAQNLGLTIGSKATLLSPQTVVSLFGSIPCFKEYEVQAIFETGVYDVDAGAIYMPLLQAQMLFQLPADSVNRIDIFLKNSKESTNITKILKNAYPNLVINDWKTSNSSYLTALEIEKNIMFLILSLIILIAIFNIVAGLVMLVHEKQRSIAILMGFGMNRWGILRIFLYCGTFISVLGAACGALFGVIFVIKIEAIRIYLEKITGVAFFDSFVYFFKDIPVSLNKQEVLGIAGFSVVVSILASIFPALRAFKKNPANILRYF